MINDNHFLELFTTSQISNSKIKKLNIEEKIYLENRYNDIFRTYKETIWRIKNNIDELPKCPECGNYVKIRYRKEKLYYHTCGNKECIYKRKGNGPRETCIKKYGVENQFQRKEIIKLIQENNFKKFGFKSHTQTLEWKEKEKQYNIEKYGVENQFQRKEIKEKIKNTCLNKYGVDHYSKSKESRIHMSEVASSNEFQEKRNNTLRKNNTWKYSKDELYIYNKLKEIFKEVLNQYSSEKYTFACDFYIKDIDLYIEYNGSDLHNFHPYNNSKQDNDELKILIEKSNKLKEKNNKKKTRYDQRIYVWTDLDVRKRNLAKQNKLNFIEFWNLKEFNEWIEKYEK